MEFSVGVSAVLVARFGLGYDLNFPCTCLYLPQARSIRKQGFVKYIVKNPCISQIHHSYFRILVAWDKYSPAFVKNTSAGRMFGEDLSKISAGGGILGTWILLSRPGSPLCFLNAIHFPFLWKRLPVP